MSDLNPAAIANGTISNDKHHQPDNAPDWIAFRLTKFLRFIADTFFAGRYGHRAVVLETVAALPDIVAGMLLHMRSLRRLEAVRKDEMLIMALQTTCHHKLRE